jgi:hypothetical protein
LADCFVPRNDESFLFGFVGKKHVSNLFKKIWVMDRVANFWKGISYYFKINSTVHLTIKLIAMKKAFIFFFFMSTLTSVLMAQTVSTLKLTPAAQSTTVSKDSFEVVLKSTLKNTSTKPKTIIWTRVYQTISPNWTAAVCDKNACWATRVNTETFTLAAGEESNLDVHLYPNGVTGSAIVNVVIADKDSANVSIVGRYGFNLAVATQDLKNTYPDIQIYPNPTPQYFSIKDEENKVFEAVVFDELGRQLKVFKKPNNSELSISELKAGNYFIGLFNQKNEVMKMVLLVKY